MLNRLFARGKEEIRAVDAPIQSALTSVSTISDNKTAGRADNATDHEMHAEGPLVQAPAVAVIAAKGGAGATTVAVNLAAAMSLLRLPTTLVDGNLQHPGVLNLLGVEPEHSIIELLARVGEIDQKLFEACALDAAANFKVLSPPVSGEAALQTDLTELARCLDLVRSYSGIWVVDLPQHLDRHLVTLTDFCARIVLVFEATVAGVAACQRWLKIFRELGYEKERIICVLNRSGSKFRGVEEQLDDSFFEQPFYRLPNCSSAHWDCANKAVPLVLENPAHVYSKAVLKLAEQITTQTMRGLGHV
jgi:pilus assembly protein CpaE